MELVYSGLQLKRVARRWNRGEAKGEYEREGREDEQKEMR